LTQEADDEPGVEIEVSTSSGGGPEARAAGQWMRRAGAKALVQALSGETLHPAILAAEVAQANPAADLERRKAEEAKAAEAARSAAAAEQKRIATEQRLRESESRANRPQPGNPEVAGSVWNVNGWHWEEKPMTEWSRSWLSKELSSLSGLQLLSGLAEAEISAVQVFGDASVSVRKGKPIILFLLRIEAKWEMAPTCAGLGDCRGSFILPEFSSEEGSSNSLVKVEVGKDESLGRLGSAFRKEGVAAVRGVLARFEEALRSQLSQS